MLVSDDYQAEWADKARGPDNNSCMTAYLARNEKEQKAPNSGRLTMMEAKKTEEDADARSRGMIPAAAEGRAICSLHRIHPVLCACACAVQAEAVT